MSTDERASEVRRLRAEGLTFQQVAQALGIGTTTAFRLVSKENAEKERERSRRWKKQNPSVCEVCGATKAHDPTKPRCESCAAAISATVNSIVAGLYNDGWKRREIAEALGQIGCSERLKRLAREGAITLRRPDHWTRTTVPHREALDAAA